MKNKWIKGWTGFLIAGLLASSPWCEAPGQTSEEVKLSLKEALEMAVSGNAQVKAAAIDLTIAKRKIWETTAIGLPQLGVDANYQHIFDVPEFSFPVAGITQMPLAYEGEIPGLTQSPFAGGLNLYMYENPEKIKLGSPDNTTINFSASQLLFSGEYLVGLQASRVFKEFSERQLAKSTNDIRESVANTYYLALVLQRSAHIMDESLGLVDRTFREMEAMYYEGFVMETDAARISIMKATLENNHRNLMGQIGVSLKLLKMQLGIDLDTPLVLTDSIEGMLLPTNLDELASEGFNLDRNVDYTLMESLTKLNHLGYRRQQSKYLPTIAAYYQHQEQTNPAAFNFMPKDVAGITLRFPIVTSGQRISQVSQARLEYEKAKLNQENAGQGLLLRFETAKNDYVTALNNYQTNGQNFNLAKGIFQKSLISFNEGVASSLELTQDHREYLEAESAYLQAMIALLNARARMENLTYQY